MSSIDKLQLSRKWSKETGDSEKAKLSQLSFKTASTNSEKKETESKNPSHHRSPCTKNSFTSVKTEMKPTSDKSKRILNFKYKS
jgi:hypothetical protein